MIVFLLSMCQILSIAAQLALKMGVQRSMPAVRSASDAWKLALEPYLWAGCGFYAFGTVLWLKILTVADLSFAYPFAAVAYAGGVLVAQWLLKEKVSFLRWAGVGVILAGLILVASSGISTTGH